MITILIVDDEPLIRYGVESIINWDLLGAKLIGNAKNGKDGLDKIRQLHPDIVLTDIKMPVMDGIQMIEQAQNEKISTYYIILSNYNDFELVKTAMKLGAVDYLMKLNLDENEIHKVLSETIEKIIKTQESHRESEQDLKYSFLKEVISLQQNNIKSEDLPIILPPSLSLKQDNYYIILYFKMLVSPSEDSNSKSYTQTYFYNMCKEHLEKLGNLYGYSPESNILTFYVETDTMISQQELLEHVREIEKRVKKYFNSNINVGISAPHKNILHVSDAIKESISSIPKNILNSESHIFFYLPPLSNINIQKKLETFKQKDWLINLLMNESIDTSVIYFAEVKQLILQQLELKQAYELCYVLLQSLYKLDINCRKFFINCNNYEIISIDDFIQRYPSKTDLYKWITQLEEGVKKYSQDYIPEIYHYKIKKAKQYIFDNKHKRITLNEVAEFLDISPAYLSRIFKKVTRQSFSDYISEVKIQEAKILLLQNNNKIYEVSNHLGYEDPYYFSKVFKKFTHMTPSEYIAKQSETSI